MNAAKQARIRKLIENDLLEEVFIDESEPIPTFDQVIGVLSTATSNADWTASLPYIAEKFEDFSNEDLRAFLQDCVERRMRFVNRCLAA